MNARARQFVFLSVTIAALVDSAQAGDRSWSRVEGLIAVTDFAVCGTTVCAASEYGLFRNTGGTGDWQLLRTAPSSYVACDGDRVFWHEVDGSFADVLYISHDALQTVALSTGISNPSPEDLAISGDMALMATGLKFFPRP